MFYTQPLSGFFFLVCVFFCVARQPQPTLTRGFSFPSLFRREQIQTVAGDRRTNFYLRPRRTRLMTEFKTVQNMRKNRALVKGQLLRQAMGGEQCREYETLGAAGATRSVLVRATAWESIKRIIIIMFLF